MDYTLIASKMRSLRPCTPVEYWISILALMIIASIIISFSVNQLFFGYTGTIYFPLTDMLLLLLIIFLIHLGFALLIPNKSEVMGFFLRFELLFSLLCLMVIYTNAIQLTPFPTIDASLVKADAFLNVDSQSLLAKTHHHQSLWQYLNFVYMHLPTELTLIMLCIALFKDKSSQNRFLFLLLSTALIGFSIYYIFPTLAPASLIDSPYFTPEQHNTGIKFYQVHHYLPVDSIEGGLIAFPSFHSIWALICQNYLSRWKILSRLCLPFNISILFSCVLLGWHYFIDVIASIMIFILALKLHNILIK